MKAYFCYFLFLFCFYFLQGQNPTDFFAKNLTVYPVSPEAASLGKYGNIPVNLATGKINYQVPLYTIKVGDFEWPIYLSYNYSGLKTEEDPGMVGLGWDLIGQGRISLEARGLPDHLDHSSFKKDYVFPYLNGVFDHLSESEKRKKILTIYERIEDGHGFDAQQDKYHFNAGNLQGSFLYDQNGNAVFSTHKNYQVNGKVITDDRGVKYFFEEEEVGETEVYINGDSYPRETKSWLLNKIELPNNKGVISFKYHDTSPQNKYTKKVYNETKTTYDSFNSQHCSVGGSGKIVIHPNETSIYIRPLKEVIFPGGKIEFKMDSFQSVNSVSFNQSDISNGNTLKAIHVFKENSFIQGYTFEYNNDNKFKKVLKKISLLDQSEKKQSYYDFEYHNEDLLQDDIPYSQQDLWGYYNNNSSRLLIRGNLASDFKKTRIGALKKITYPTLGYSLINYEQNDVLVKKVSNEESIAEINSYSHNEIFVKRISIKPSNSVLIDTIINLGNTQIVDAQINVGVEPYNSNQLGYAEVFMTLSQVENTPLLPPNVKYQPLNLHLTISEENLFDPNQINENGGLLKSKQDLAFVKDGKIRLKGEILTSFNTEAFVNIRIKYDGSIDSEQYNKSVGGIRVESVIDSDGFGNESTTKYNYRQEDGIQSSGKFLSKNLFFSHRTAHSSSYDECITLNVSAYHEFSRSKQPFTSYQGNPVLYDRVEIIKNNGKEGKTINVYSKSDDFEESNGFPYPPIENNDWKKGKLLDQFILNQKGDTLTHIKNQYKETFPFNKGLSSSKKILGLVVGKHHFANVSRISDFKEIAYSEYPKIMVLDKTITTQYGGNNNKPLVQTTTYHYDSPQTQTQQVVTTQSDGREQLTKLTYPYNHPNHPLTLHNRIAEPIETTTYKVEGTHRKKLSTQKTIYKEENGLVVSAKIQTAKGEDALEDRVLFDRYDGYGNVLEHHTAGSEAHTVTLWGYNGQYPIARIENATYGEVQQALGLSGSQEPSESHLTAINALRSSKKDWMITTYEHIPLVGVKKITQPNGLSTHYRYDDLNRLQIVRDHAKKLLEEYQYHYAGGSLNPDGDDDDNTGKKPLKTYYYDGDGDGLGDVNESIRVTGDTPPSNYVSNASDRCPEVFGKEEDQGCPLVTYYYDGDDDGLGDAATTTQTTHFNQPTDYVDNKDDRCPDASGEEENQGCPLITYYYDGDDDGLGDATTTTRTTYFNQPTDYVDNKDDQCPSVKGEKAHSGCPVFSVTDAGAKVSISRKGVISVLLDKGTLIATQPSEFQPIQVGREQEIELEIQIPSDYYNSGGHTKIRVKAFQESSDIPLSCAVLPELIQIDPNGRLTLPEEWNHLSMYGSGFRRDYQNGGGTFDPVLQPTHRRLRMYFYRIPEGYSSTSRSLYCYDVVLTQPKAILPIFTAKDAQLEGFQVDVSGNITPPTTTSKASILSYSPRSFTPAPDAMPRTLNVQIRVPEGYANSGRIITVSTQAIQPKSDLKPLSCAILPELIRIDPNGKLILPEEFVTLTKRWGLFMHGRNFRRDYQNGGGTFDPVLQPTQRILRMYFYRIPEGYSSANGRLYCYDVVLTQPKAILPIFTAKDAQLEGFQVDVSGNITPPTTASKASILSYSPRSFTPVPDAMPRTLRVQIRVPEGYANSGRTITVSTQALQPKSDLKPLNCAILPELIRIDPNGKLILPEEFVPLTKRWDLYMFGPGFQSDYRNGGGTFDPVSQPTQRRLRVYFYNIPEGYSSASKYLFCYDLVLTQPAQ